SLAKTVWSRAHSRWDGSEVRAFASPAAPTKSCATSSPSACSVCRRTSAWTRTCPSTRHRQESKRCASPVRGRGVRTTMALEALEHFTITCADLERTRDFYRDVLG